LWRLLQQIAKFHLHLIKISNFQIFKFSDTKYMTPDSSSHCVQAGIGVISPTEAGMSGKNAKKMRKALQQLAEEEAAPKRVRVLTPAEVAEGVK